MQAFFRLGSLYVKDVVADGVVVTTEQNKATTFTDDFDGFLTEQLLKHIPEFWIDLVSIQNSKPYGPEFVNDSF